MTPYFRDELGKIRFRQHEGQRRALASTKRFILVLAGTQSGKTVLGPWWMLREICRRGPGDYLVVAPTFRLLDMKCLPEYRGLFEDRLEAGVLKGHPAPVFHFSDQGQAGLFGKARDNRSSTDTPTRILFGHAQDPDSLESATAKAAHLDESGQRKFKLGSWEAVMRRLAIHEGRAIHTTTPYSLGWLKSELHDRALRGDPNIDLIRFESTMNPAFPKTEFERARASLPRWKFDMMYRAIFTRPAGMIYDCFAEHHRVKDFPIPDTWHRYVGLDFGGTNTAAVYIAEDPDTRKLYLYDRYHEGGRTAAEHAVAIRRGHKITRAVGGSMSEDQWRLEFGAGGLRVHPPDVKDVEVGIQRVYTLLKSDRLFVFDSLRDVIDDLESYSRELDDKNEPTEKIEDKATYHRLDALRYIATYLERKTEPARINRAMVHI